MRSLADGAFRFRRIVRAQGAAQCAILVTDSAARHDLLVRSPTQVLD